MDLSTNSRKKNENKRNLKFNIRLKEVKIVCHKMALRNKTEIVTKPLKTKPLKNDSEKNKLEQKISIKLEKNDDPEDDTETSAINSMLMNKNNNITKIILKPLKIKPVKNKSEKNKLEQKISIKLEKSDDTETSAINSMLMNKNNNISKVVKKPLKIKPLKNKSEKKKLAQKMSIKLEKTDDTEDDTEKSAINSMLMNKNNNIEDFIKMNVIRKPKLEVEELENELNELCQILTMSESNSDNEIQSINNKTFNDETSNDKITNDETSNDKITNDETSNDKTTNDETTNDTSSNTIKLSCKLCHTKFKRERNYTIHMRNVHQILSEPPTCNVCKKTFVHKGSLKEHKKLHLPYEEREKDFFKCEHCETKYARKYQLVNHIRSVHTKDRPFFCETCGKCYSTLNNLYSHRKDTHEKVPSTCPICKNTFASKSNLTKHLKSHKAPTVQCTICDDILKSKKSLKVHMLIHTETRPFKCNYCPKDFKRSEFLQLHMVTHTGLKPYKCQFCERSFANRSNCNKHEQQSHPKELEIANLNGNKTRVAQKLPSIYQLSLMLEAGKKLNFSKYSENE